MLASETYCKIMSLIDTNNHKDMRVRIHIGNLLYDIDHIDTVIDMDTNLSLIHI